MHIIRCAVKENVLSDPGRVTYDDYAAMLLEKGKGWVAETSDGMAGFSIIDLHTHNVWALFVHPNHECKGAGRMLHDRMLDWSFRHTTHPLWLSTTKNTRAEKFYRLRGWKDAGMQNNEEIRFEMSIEDYRIALKSSNWTSPER